MFSCAYYFTVKNYMTVTSGTKLLTAKLRQTCYWTSAELLLLEIKKISNLKTYNKIRVHFYKKILPNKICDK